MGTIPPVSASSQVPAYRSPIVQDLFGRHHFQATPLPNMAVMKDPASGFQPTRLFDGTEVLWIAEPSQLGVSFGATVTPLWKNGLGLVVYRNEECQCLGAIFIHGAMKAPWSDYGPKAWHSLGGIMAFSGLSFEKAIEMVVGKGYAMTPKWQFIDMSLAAAGHTTLTNLGGGKAIFLHGPTNEDKERGVAVSAEVAAALGIYISGPDQNMDPSWCGKFACLAPKNFVGSEKAEGKYKGIKPSKHTARGIFRGVRVVCDELIGDKPPIFFEGYGGVGKVMAALAVENNFPISGIVDIEVGRLLEVKQILRKTPFFFNITAAEEQHGPEWAKGEEGKARQNGIAVVKDLAEALRQAKDTVILSPNGSPHPVTQSVAEYLYKAHIRAVVGATNNMLGLDGNGTGSSIAWYLMQKGIFVPNDSRINRIGAMACMIDMIDLDRAVGLALQIRQVGEDVRDEINAYRQGIPPQLYSDDVAAKAWNQALDEERAIGGRFPESNLAGYVKT